MPEKNARHFSIAPATSDDAAIIGQMAWELLDEIMRSIGQPVFNADLAQLSSRCEDFLARGIYTVFMATTAQNSPAGFIAIYESHALYAEGAFGTIPECYVRPDYRSHGVGAQLLQAAKEYGLNQGWKRLEVTTPPLPAFDRTFRFYETQGFDMAGGRKMKVLL
ncbi:MAG: GNAT family N-acetyltransferase [Gallionellaceae bacterium]|nr:GNAT family N-acetyltransferase [Gallionellaceae bacterium]